MATTAFSSKAIMRGVRLTTWAAIPNGNQGSPQSMASLNDKCVQVTGTFGAAGSVNLEGSNDGTTWAILKDPQGAALTFTSAGLKEVLENPLYTRPNVTAGDGTTALNVYLVQKGGFI